MKKILLALLLLPLGLIARPTEEPENEVIRQKAAIIARSLVEPLQLNELEYIKVRDLAAQQIMALNDIADYYKYDPAMMAKKIEEAEIAYERRIKYILNSQQLESYLSMQNSEK